MEFQCAGSVRPAASPGHCDVRGPRARRAGVRRPRLSGPLQSRCKNALFVNRLIEVEVRQIVQNEYSVEKSASIQPRTSNPKFGNILSHFEKNNMFAAKNAFARRWTATCSRRLSSCSGGSSPSSTTSASRCPPLSARLDFSGLAAGRLFTAPFCGCIDEKRVKNIKADNGSSKRSNHARAFQILKFEDRSLNAGKVLRILKARASLLQFSDARPKDCLWNGLG